MMDTNHKERSRKRARGVGVARSLLRANFAFYLFLRDGRTRARPSVAVRHMRYAERVATESKA